MISVTEELPVRRTSVGHLRIGHPGNSLNQTQPATRLRLCRHGATDSWMPALPVPARRSGRALGRPSQTRRERDLGAGGGQGPAGVLLSSSDSDPDLESVDCLRCRGCRRRFASVASLRLHINHIKLRNTKCASQARKNPRILVTTWRRGRDGQATGVVDGLEADQDSEQDELAGSMAAAGNNMDLPVDADLDLPAGGSSRRRDVGGDR